MNRPTNKNKATDHLSFNCPEQRIAQLITEAKDDFEGFFASLKLCLVEFLFLSEREMLAGPKHHPLPGWKKWGSQPGSVYVGGEKMRVNKPRLRKDQKEIPLSIYQALGDKDGFSMRLLEKAFRGISCRDYEHTLDGLLENFGISKSSVSRHLKLATSQQLDQLKERNLKDIEPFALFIDGYHVGDKVFIVALAIDLHGKKHVLGFWEGASENSEVCEELFGDLERRGFELNEQVLYITDGGKGVIKSLKLRFGEQLLHQRCTVHKDRNIQKHLPKKYRKAAHSRFRNAIDCSDYKDAQEELKRLEKWLEGLNPSAAESLRECHEELLTVHRLKVPPLLRKSLHTTNPIESMFSQASQRIGRITRMRGGEMAQRWVGTALLSAEKKFRTVKGHLSIEEVRSNITSLQGEVRAAAA